MVVMVALAISVTPAQAACGQRTTDTARHWTGGGAPPLVVGDSVLYDVAPALAGLGFQVDAMVCRQFDQGLQLLAGRGRTLPHLVVLALGTNGSVSLAQIGTALHILGSGRLLGLVTPHNGVVPSDVPTMFEAQRQHPGQIVVLDWNRVAGGHANWFAPDGIHLGGQAGINAFARMVATLLPFAVRPPCAG
jgi:hypothetical protein